MTNGLTNLSNCIGYAMNHNLACKIGTVCVKTGCFLVVQGIIQEIYYYYF